jgi:transcriptional regulator with XRE-family HTH domain
MAVKSSHSNSSAPFAVTDACRALGERLAVARKRRRLTQKELARRAGLSAFTIIRIEKGVASTELGSVVRVLWALGLDGSLASVADTAGDDVGQALERARLPKRVTGRKEQLDDDF